MRKPGVKVCLKRRDEVQSHGSEVGGGGTTLVHDCPRRVVEGVGGGVRICLGIRVGAMLLDRPTVVVVGGVNDRSGEDQRKQLVILLVAVVGGQGQKVKKTGIRLLVRTPTSTTYTVCHPS